MGEAMSGTAAAPTARVLSCVPRRAKPGAGRARWRRPRETLFPRRGVGQAFPRSSGCSCTSCPATGTSSRRWSVVARLKESLPATLALYVPLAGKVSRVVDSGDLFVDCSDLGVAFVEVEVAEGAVDARRLAGD